MNMAKTELASTGITITTDEVQTVIACHRLAESCPFEPKRIT